MGERRVGGWRSQSLGNANPIRVIPKSWESGRGTEKNAYLKRKVGQLPSVSHHIVLWVWWHRWVGPPKKVTRDQLLWLCSLSHTAGLHTTTLSYYNPYLGNMKTFFCSSLVLATVFLLNFGFFRCNRERLLQQPTIRPHLAQNQNHKGPEKLICL